MSIPAADLPVPDLVARLARGASLTPVWANDAGGVTFRAEPSPASPEAPAAGPAEPASGVRYIKLWPRDGEVTAADEAARLAWAAPYATVPRVVEHGADATQEWLVTEEVAGTSAVAPAWLARPAVAVAAIGRGLRLLHDALPVGDCPFTWSVEERASNASARGIEVPRALLNAPPVDRLVVCHGDACAPNTLLDEKGEPAAHVDLGALGVADRWADLAVASLSTVWNYGEGWEDVLIEAYGLRPDRERIVYYRALWDAT